MKNKVPPPIIGLISAFIIYLLAQYLPTIYIPELLKYILLLIFLIIGISFDFSAIIKFVKNQTTINPLEPSKSKKLVTEGIYRISRNPMYIGMVFLLLSWCTYLSTLFGLIGIIFFIGYITKFQIKPEEEALLNNFGEDFENYKFKVRMWL